MSWLAFAYVSTRFLLCLVPLGKQLWIEPLYWLLIVNLLQNSTVPDSSRPDECEAAGRGFVPPPFLPVRAPLFPVDPRSQFVRRAPPFPPPPPGNIYAAPRDYFPPRDFPGPPPPLFPGWLFKKIHICVNIYLCFSLALLSVAVINTDQNQEKRIRWLSGFRPSTKEAKASLDPL